LTELQDFFYVQKEAIITGLSTM